MLIKYRAKDGLTDYTFSFEYEGNGYRAYITDMPSYGNRDKSLTVTHRLMSNNRHYVCWNQPLYTQEDLKKVVALWSDLTQTYIRAGSTIDQQMQDKQRGDQINRGTFHHKDMEPENIGSQPQDLHITAEVYDSIYKEIGRRSAEQGGPLGGSRDDFVVEHFYFDKSALRTGATYSPDYEHLNDLFSKKWNPAGISLLGFVHSHPNGFWRPSSGDLFYAEEILRGIPDLPYLLLPIVKTERDTGKFEIFPFAAVRGNSGVRIVKLKLEVIANDRRFRPPVKDLVGKGQFILVVSDGQGPSRTAVPEMTGTMPRNVSNKADLPGREVYVSTGAPSGTQTTDRREPIDLTPTFERVREAYDLKRMAATRIIYVGAGGAASFIEELARIGVGEHVLIDPDVVSEINIVTQQVYRKDIGRFKVECIAERINDINPNAIVRAYPRSLDDLDDSEFAQILATPLADGNVPAVTLLCGLTDNFYAQARVNNLALQFELPSLCAQVYQEGRAAEVTFTFPGITPACHRCILSKRYDAYLKESFQNTVNAEGTPIFATTRLNALKGFIALALLHHGTDHPRWGKLLEKIRNRNLLQIRMDPDFPFKVFERVFDQGDQERILFDETVWLPQEPMNIETESFPCPACRGTGDLRTAKGTFKDTRTIQ